MKHLPRVFMIVASLLLFTLFLFPMWKITLYAPQYPQGVAMYIYVNKIGGEEKGTLQNINILNHYVGMKPIEPESIPELKIFPYITFGLIGLGLLAALINKRQMYLGWAIFFSVIALLGIYDFYLWEYDYGHDLDPNAPMKFPGASFQPPVFGTKDILNFVAKSFPSTSGYMAMLSVVFSLGAWWLKRKFDKSNEKVTSNSELSVASK